MTCTEVQESLALFVYGDLSSEDTSRVQTHLDECPNCLRGCESLKSLKRDLSQLPVPEVQVDVSRIVSQSQTIQERSIRRWKRATIGIGVLAASLMLVMVFRVQIRMDGQQLVIFWGTPPETKQVEPIPLIPSLDPKQLVELEDRIHVLNKLILALSNDWDTNEKQRKADLAWVTTQMDALQLETQKRWIEMKRDFSALYSAQFSRGEGGNE